MKKYDLGDVVSVLGSMTGVLFWAPILTSIFGWYNVSTYLFVSFFVCLGLTIIFSTIVFMEERENQSKTARLFQWFFLIAGLFMVAVGFGILEFEPILLLFSLPLVRLLSSRSLTDIIGDKAGNKHPWMDRLSDGSFLLSALMFTLMFFGFVSEIAISVMLMLLGVSLTIDQIHYGINTKNWSTAGLLIAVAVGVFFTPGVVILVLSL